MINLMSDKRALLALGTIVTLAALLSVSQISTTNSVPLATGTILGHVTTTVLDNEGNIKAYRQSDNDIVNQGFDCATDRIFGTDYAGCVGIIDDISINRDQTINSGDTTLANPIQTAAGTLVTATKAIDGSGTATLRYTNEFSITGDNTVSSTGLLSGGTLFAGQTIGSPIPVVDGDKVTISWKLTVT